MALLAAAAGFTTGFAVLPEAPPGVALDPATATSETGAIGSPALREGLDASLVAVSPGGVGDVADPRPVPAPASVGDPDALDAAGLSAADRAAGLLSTDVPPSASGRLAVVPGAAPAPGPGPVRTVRIEVEVGLPVDAELFAATVMGILNDPRGWGAGGAMTFARTDGDAELGVVLASPATVDGLCAPLETDGLYSCARSGRATINFLRWSAGATSFGTDRTLYRQYVISHEVGHVLGHRHERCPGPGRPAPVMQQQTASVAPCLPTAFPTP